jgi:plastocyanin
MRNLLLRLGIVLGLTLPALAAGGTAVHADDMNATVTITDSGFNPPVINVTRGGTVVWTNGGTKVHTATAKVAPTPFDTGGLGPGQSFPFNFTVAGTYSYTSATDCSNTGGSGSGFNCGAVGVVNVVDLTLSSNPNAFNVPPTPTPTPVLSGPPQSVLIHINKDGFSPAQATIALGGSVTFINDDNTKTHNAIAIAGGNPMTWDTGGLPPGTMGSVGLTIQGTYTYTSATDCLNGNSTTGFNCGPYQVIVSPQPVAFASVPGAVAGTGVTMDDAQGFSPKVLLVRAGDTVTWTNGGKQVHTVVSDPGYIPTFDSGGLDPSKKFSVKFATAGSYNYHSSTEATYVLDGMGNQVAQYMFTGTIVAQ